jgi:hypothetical protein
MGSAVHYEHRPTVGQRYFYLSAPGSTSPWRDALHRSGVRRIKTDKYAKRSIYQMRFAFRGSGMVSPRYLTVGTDYGGGMVFSDPPH